MAWVDLGDLYVKKAGDNVTGSIVMANNNLSVAYDADTTYNVGTEIKSLRDSVNKSIGACQILSVASGFFINAYEGSGMITIGGNVSPSANLSAGDIFCKIKTSQEFVNNEHGILFRGCFSKKQSGVKIDFSSDKHTIRFSVEQTTAFSQADTMSFSFPVLWKF